MTVSTLRLKRSIARNNRELIDKVMKNIYDEIEEPGVGRGHKKTGRKSVLLQNVLLGSYKL